MELYHGRLDKKPDALAIRVRWYGPNDPQVVYFERKTHHESWTGEESVKERFEIEAKNVMPYMLGEYKAIYPLPCHAVSAFLYDPCAHHQACSTSIEGMLSAES